mmetsp:Transcript_8640/g.27532  ORF Transcript_8640/g.27532 Transcript_8640/m.27532 type:complete len:223 (+) Transcript_8640:483-1151(+)
MQCRGSLLHLGGLGHDLVELGQCRRQVADVPHQHDGQGMERVNIGMQRIHDRGHLLPRLLVGGELHVAQGLVLRLPVRLIHQANQEIPDHLLVLVAPLVLLLRQLDLPVTERQVELLRAGLFEAVLSGELPTDLPDSELRLRNGHDSRGLLVQATAAAELDEPARPDLPGHHVDPVVVNDLNGLLLEHVLHVDGLELLRPELIEVDEVVGVGVTCRTLNLPK